MIKNTIPTYHFTPATTDEYLAKYFSWGDYTQPYDYSEPHAHDFHEIFFFLEKGGNHLMGIDEYSINKYDVHFLPAHFVHRLRREKQVNGFTIGCSSLFLEQIQGFEKKIDYNLFFTIPRVINLDESDIKTLLYYFNEVEKSTQEDGYFLNLVSLIFQQVISKSKTQIYRDDNQSEIGKIIKLVNENYKEKKSSLFYADKMNRSVISLNHLCKNHFNKTIVQIQRDKIVMELKQLLLFTNKSISEIAYSFNFSDASHFSHFFKKQTNKAPLEYRKNTSE